MMTRHFLIILFFFYASAASVAQISGFVKDKNTGKM
ncbi:MAG: hypothetical protein RI909_1451, partial [Bacteroidota bacterium]